MSAAIVVVVVVVVTPPKRGEGFTLLRFYSHSSIEVLLVQFTVAVDSECGTSWCELLFPGDLWRLLLLPGAKKWQE